MITVCVRKRPLVNHETNDIIDIDTNNNVLTVNQIRKGVDLRKCIQKSNFRFNHVFSEKFTNYNIFNTLLKHKINNNIDKKILLAVYGETGSGKTHTLLDNQGLLIHTIKLLLKKNYAITVSAYEIYNNHAYDLISNRQKCIIRENYNNDFVIANLSKYSISTYNILHFITTIKNNRIVGQSAKNLESSRSHAIIDLFITMPSQKKIEMRFIDLAGSERGTLSFPKNKYQLREGSEINNSLLSFKECIRAMHSNNNHIPFRRSSLTKLLRNYFINRHDIIIIGNISPTSKCIRGTLNTLQYISMLQKIKNKLKYTPKENVIPKSVLSKKKKYMQEYNKSVLKNSKIATMRLYTTSNNSTSLYKINVPNINIKPYPVNRDLKTITIDNSIYIFDYFINDIEKQLYKYKELLYKIKTNKFNKINWENLNKLITEKYDSNRKINTLFIKSIKGILSFF